MSELAHHYGRSGNAAKAIEYLDRAGRRAVERSAYVEAVNHLSAALELLRAMPYSRERSERELALLLALGPPVQVTKGWSSPEAEKIYLRAREICREVGETPQLLLTLFGLAGYYVVGGEYKTARELMDQCLNLAQLSGDSNMLVQAYHSLGYLHTFTGELSSARQAQDELARLYDSKTHHPLARLYAGDNPAVCSLGVKSLTLWLQGYPQQAVLAAEASRRLAEQLSHPLSIGVAISDRVFLETFRRERTNALEQAKAVVALSEDHGFSTYVEGGAIVESLLAPDRATPEGAGRIRRDLAAWGTKGGSIPDGWSDATESTARRAISAASVLRATTSRNRGLSSTPRCKAGPRHST